MLTEVNHGEGEGQGKRRQTEVGKGVEHDTLGLLLLLYLKKDWSFKAATPWCLFLNTSSVNTAIIIIYNK